MILFVPNAIALLSHVIVVSLAAYGRPTKEIATLAVLSSVLLVVGIALQRDFGDGRGAWLVFTAVFTPHVGDTGTIPSWWPLRGSPYWDLLWFIPLIASWMILCVCVLRPQTP